MNLRMSYCVVCNYEPPAARLSAYLENYEERVTLVKGSGVFDGEMEGGRISAKIAFPNGRRSGKG